MAVMERPKPRYKLTFPSARRTLSTAHAPAGGVDIQSQHFIGGEFIPSASMARATPEELDEIQPKEPHEHVERWMDAPHNAHLSPKSRQEIGDSLRRVLKQLPQPMAEEIVKKMKAAPFFYESAIEVTKELNRREVAIGRKPCAPGEGVAGFYEADTGELHTDHGYAGDREAADQVNAHELGHVLDGEDEISGLTEWNLAYHRNIATRPLPLGDYAASNPAEGLAEFVSAIATTPEYAKKRCPACWAVLAKRGLVE